LDIEMMDSVSLDDPVRMYLKEIGRVSLLTANDEVELAQAIEAKPLHDAMKALNVIEEVDGRQRSVDELLPEVIERLATVKRKGQQSHIAQELLGLIDLGKLPNLTDAAAAERRRIANGARPRVRAVGRRDRRGDGDHAGEGARDREGFAGPRVFGDADRRGRGLAPGGLRGGSGGGVPVGRGFFDDAPFRGGGRSRHLDSAGAP